MRSYKMNKYIKYGFLIFFSALIFSCSIKIGTDIKVEVYNSQTSVYDLVTEGTDTEIEGKLGINRDKLEKGTSPYLQRDSDGFPFIKFRLTNLLEAPVQISLNADQSELSYIGNQLVPAGEQLDVIYDFRAEEGRHTPYHLVFSLSGGGLAVFKSNKNSVNLYLNLNEDFFSIGLNGQEIEMAQGETLLLQDFYPDLRNVSFDSLNQEIVQAVSTDEGYNYLRALSYGSAVMSSTSNINFTIYVQPFEITLKEDQINYTVLKENDPLPVDLQFSTEPNTEYQIRISEQLGFRKASAELSKLGVGVIENIEFSHQGVINFTSVEGGMHFLKMSATDWFVVGESRSMEIELIRFPPLESFSISETSLSIVNGQVIQIPTVTVPVYEYALTWNSHDESVALVSDTGNITGLKPGTAVITVYPDNSPDNFVDISVIVTASPITLNNRTFGEMNSGEVLLYTVPVLQANSYDLLFEDGTSSIFNCEGEVTFKVTHSIDGLLIDNQPADAFNEISLSGIVSDGILTIEATAISGSPANFNFTLWKQDID